MDKLILKKGGHLIKTYYDESQEKWLDKDISDEMFISPKWLHEVGCSLEDGLILKDIFTYMNRNPNYWHMMLGNWCDEYLIEGMKAPSKPKDANLHYIETYWSCETSHEDDGVYVCWAKFMDVHIKGVNGKDEPDIGMKADDPMNYSVMFMSANDLAQYPIKVNPEFKIYKDICECKDLKAGQEVLFEVDIRQPTLFELLYGIIWELSFHGGPESRDKQEKELMDSWEEAKKEIDSGNLKTVSLEDIFDETQESDKDE